MRNIRLFGSVLLAVLIMASCSGNKTSNSSTADLKVSWGVISNLYQGKDGVRSYFTIVNNGKEPMGKNWSLYFNFCRTIKEDSANPVLGNVKFVHINGDFFKIVPNDSFKLAAGDSVRIEFTANNWLMNYSDAPAGLYIVYTNDGKEGEPQAITNYT